MGSINTDSDEFSKDGQSGLFIFFVFFIQGNLGMTESIIRQIHGYMSVCRWVWNRNNFFYCR